MERGKEAGRYEKHALCEQREQIVPLPGRDTRKSAVPRDLIAELRPQNPGNGIPGYTKRVSAGGVKNFTKKFPRI